MTIELTMLLYSVILAVGITLIPATDSILKNGVLPMMGNRDSGLAEPSLWNKRARRAAANMAENLPWFAALVLVAHAADVSTPNTILGAQLFFWGRVGHAATYIAGVPHVRTLAWAVGIVGMGLIAWELAV